MAKFPVGRLHSNTAERTKHQIIFQNSEHIASPIYTIFKFIID